MGFFQEYIRKIQKSTNNVKIVLIALLALVPVILFSILYYSGADKAVLFSGISEKDITKITMALDSKGIPYDIDLAASSIHVEESKVHDIRMMLMSDGVILDSNVGFEIFNDSEFGMTEFSQKINYQRALQGELSRTISSLNEVLYARVHIVQPENKLFKTKDDVTTSSITLFIKEGMQLNPEQVKGIQNIVSFSVDKLSPENVIVTNQSGIVLSDNSSPKEKFDEQKLTRREKLEKYYTSKVNEILSSTLNNDNFIASVNIELDYTKSFINKEDYINPSDTTAIVRERVSRTEKTGASSKDVEYKLGKMSQNTELESGRIKRISIGVLLGNTISQDRLDKLKKVIQMATGIKPERGDSIAIFADDFSNIADESKNISTPARSNTSSYIAEKYDVATANSSDMIENNYLDKMLNKYNLTKSSLFYSMAIAIVLLLLINLYMMLTKRSRFPKKATELDRQNLLNEIAEWIGKDEQNGK